MSCVRRLNISDRRTLRASRFEPAMLQLADVGVPTAYDCHSMGAWELSRAAYSRLAQFANAEGVVAASDTGERESVLRAAGLASADVPEMLSFDAPAFGDPPPAQSRFTYLVLEATHKCNLSCSYCYRAHGLYDSLDTSLSASDALRALKRFWKPDGRIGFFGGEPLIEFGMIREVVKRASPSGFHITTNGVLLSDGREGERMVRYLAEHKPSLIVSLDGPAEYHNASRPLRGGDSFGAVMCALERLHEAGLGDRITLRATYGGQRPGIGERLRFLNALKEQGYANHVSVEPWFLPRGDGMANAVDTVRAWETDFQEACWWWLEEWQAGRTPAFHHLTTMLSRIAYQEANASECGAGKGYAAIGPTGTVFACHRESKTAIGDIDTGFDEHARLAWQDNYLTHRTACPTCSIRWACGGGCRLNSLEWSGDIRQPVPANCEFARIRFRAAMRLLAAAPASVLRAAVRPRSRRLVRGELTTGQTQHVYDTGPLATARTRVRLVPRRGQAQD